ncbi:hypothetical protein NPX13_g2938 [Xylaria arbuscula]|uniref:Uncharacterized protein n=1 Tax=Xylaria arbuscula TaxID=114810 RepID=A0A9W8NJG3_9PEZI|nr:hypothetical protein NPX13_g2938 [Xylaria arbuscula]
MSNDHPKVKLPRVLTFAITPKTGVQQNEQEMYVLVDRQVPQSGGKLTTNGDHPSDSNTITPNSGKGTTVTDGGQMTSSSGNDAK